MNTYTVLRLQIWRVKQKDFSVLVIGSILGEWYNIFLIIIVFYQLFKLFT